MRTTDRMLWLAGVLGLAVACGPPPQSTIQLSASSERTMIGNDRFVTLTLTGEQGGKPGLLDGAVVNFDTTHGVFESQDAGQQQATALTEGGRAEIRLYSPPQPGVAEVTATLFDTYSQKVLKATIEITWTTPAVARLEFNCASKNIMAFDTSYEMLVKCTASAEDEQGNAVPGAVIKFRTEAGQMEKDDDGNWVYNPRVGARLTPLDLEPLGDASTGEPRVSDGTKTRNPRDGLVTIIAWVEGTEGATGEPFVDVDDDGEFSARENTFYEDINKNGQRDDDAGPLWQSTKILWTGKASQNAAVAAVQFAGGNGTLEANECKRITFTVVDENFNILAANAAGDAITFQTTGASGPTNFDGPETTTLPNGYGINIDSRGRITGANQRASYMVGANHAVTVCNGQEEGSDDTTYQVYGSISRNTFINATGEPDGSGPDNETTIFSPRSTLKGVPGLGLP